MSAACEPRDDVLPWPRTADDGTPLGVDLQQKAGDVRRIVRKHFHLDTGTLDTDDLIQEVLLAILRKNHQESAYDPRRASLSKYIYIVASSIRGHLLESARAARRRIKPGVEVPDVADERDPVAAYEDAASAGVDIAWCRAAVDFDASPDPETAAPPPKPTQLALFA